MADRLSRERIAELRDLLCGGARPSRQSFEDLLAVLDAYEAQRPRPASEVPEDSETVLVYGRRYPHSAARWWVGHYADYDRCAPVGIPRHEWCEWRTDDHRVITVAMAWLPLPPAPERDDG